MLIPEWREKELDRQRLKEDRRRQEGKSSKSLNSSKHAWRKRNKAKSLAHAKVSLAIKTGNLMQMPCQKCGDQNAQAHHDDYSKPLNVRWFCPKHHAEHHVEMRRLERFTRDQLNQATTPKEQ
jgi:ribosomal protein S27AE